MVSRMVPQDIRTWAYWPNVGLSGEAHSVLYGPRKEGAQTAIDRRTGAVSKSLGTRIASWGGL